MSPAYTALINQDIYGLVGRLLGENQAATPKTFTDKLAFSTVLADGGRLSSRISLLRNAENMNFSVTSEDGKTEYWHEEYGSARKTYFYANGGSFTTTSPKTAWDGKDKTASRFRKIRS